MRVCVIGCGLIGGSIVLALRERQWPVVVYDHNESQRGLLKDAGLPVIDSAEDLSAPDIFVIATPPETLSSWAVDLLQTFPSSVVTDTGSVKCLVDDQVRDRLNQAQLERWVPGHPLSGSQAQGYAGASPDLFQGNRWLLCPQENNGSALSVVEGMVRALGAKPTLISCENHDSLVAWSSHLPHASSAALQLAISQATGAELKQITGTGLMDATRLADMDPWLWQSILLANRGNVMAAITGLEEQLSEVKRLLEESDQEGLVQWISQAALDRGNLRYTRDKTSPSVD